MMRHTILFSMLTMWFLSCSNEQSLHGIDSKVEEPEPLEENASTEIIKPAPAPEPEPQPEPEPEPEPVKNPLIQECKEEVDYDPSEFLCSLPVSGQTVWDAVGEWKNREDQVIDRDSSWVSAAPVEKNYCASIPQSDQLIFVSNFTITSDMNIRIQSIIDNYGTVMIWKDADPLKTVYTSDKNVPWINDELQIQSGFYSVIVDSVDTGFASGIVLSVFDSDTEVSILNSNSAATGLVPWCMFRRSSTSDKSTTDFVRDVSSCRPCLVGYEDVQGQL